MAVRVLELRPRDLRHAAIDLSSCNSRYFITLSDGHSLWGYPGTSGLNAGDMAWAIDNGNTYLSWDQVQASAESDATVTGAFVVADADQAPGTVSENLDDCVERAVERGFLDHERRREDQDVAVAAAAPYEDAPPA